LSSRPTNCKVPYWDAHCCHQPDLRRDHTVQQAVEQFLSEYLEVHAQDRNASRARLLMSNNAEQFLVHHMTSPVCFDDLRVSLSRLPASDVKALRPPMEDLVSTCFHRLSSCLARLLGDGAFTIADLQLEKKEGSCECCVSLEGLVLHMLLQEQQLLKACIYDD
jgi:hypothetical protein